MILSLLLALLPSHASCPRGFVLSHGIRPTGEFECYLWPRVDSDDVSPISVTHSQIYCARGVPVVRSERDVGCWRAR